MTIRPCPVCHSNKFTDFKIINQYFHHVRIFCKKCNTVFFNKLIKHKPEYDYEYNAHFFREGDISKARIMGHKIAMLALDNWAHPNIFEIGVGNGLTLWEIFKHRIPCAGVDIDKKLCDTITNHLNIPVYSGGLENFTTKRKYKIVYSSHVIEHFEDPYIFMKKAFSLLDHDGIIYLDTPDISQNKRLDPAWHHFKTRNPLEHCCILSKKSLAILGGFYGLSIVWFKSFRKYGSFQAILSRSPKTKTRTL
jgi:2-polyprenyl-3-methyl-5-hydroxy-6-metoxy-1,4-benzoquinol methylase